MKQETFVRLSTRITKEQHKYIKVFAKKNKKTEGATIRTMIEEFIRHYK